METTMGIDVIVVVVGGEDISDGLENASGSNARSRVWVVQGFVVLIHKSAEDCVWQWRHCDDRRRSRWRIVEGRASLTGSSCLFDGFDSEPSPFSDSSRGVTEGPTVSRQWWAIGPADAS
ncbi:hypothetical protein M758_4G230000 [Ceratodon purpureus]|nr:hypothetical protein M758_4G230000 [Ceratodon purpureus]